MADKQITQNGKESGKDKMLKDVIEKITGQLGFLKDSLGQKKFDKRVRKAGKLLIDGIKSAEKKSSESIPAKTLKPTGTKLKKAPLKKKVAKSTITKS